MGIKTRIIIADDNVHICKFMQYHLSKYDDIEILGIANTDEDEIKMIEELKPEIVITDLVRNHEYTGLEIIKSYYEKKSKIRFLVVSADKKEDVINDGLEVAGYIEKTFSFDYGFLYNELKRIKQGISDEKYNGWDKKYHTLEYIDLRTLFDEDERNTLKKLGITIKNKEYTEYEIDLIKRELWFYMEPEDEAPEIIEELKIMREYIEDKGVSQLEFDKLMEKIDAIEF